MSLSRSVSLLCLLGLGKFSRRSSEWRPIAICCGMVLSVQKRCQKSSSNSEGKSFLSCTYRIVADGKPLILINEKFPLDE